MSEIEVEQLRLIHDLRAQIRELRRSRQDIAMDASGYETELCSIRQQLAGFIESPEDPTWVLALRAKHTVANLRKELDMMVTLPRLSDQDPQKAITA